MSASGTTATCASSPIPRARSTGPSRSSTRISCASESCSVARFRPARQWTSGWSPRARPRAIPPRPPRRRWPGRRRCRCGRAAAASAPGGSSCRRRRDPPGGRRPARVAPADAAAERGPHHGEDVCPGQDPGGHSGVPDEDDLGVGQERLDRLGGVLCRGGSRAPGRGRAGPGGRSRSPSIRRSAAPLRPPEGGGRGRPSSGGQVGGRLMVADHDRPRTHRFRILTSVTSCARGRGRPLLPQPRQRGGGRRREDPQAVADLPHRRSPAGPRVRPVMRRGAARRRECRRASGPVERARLGPGIGVRRQAAGDLRRGPPTGRRLEPRDRRSAAVAT